MKSEEIIRNTLKIYSGDKNLIAKHLTDYITVDSKYQVLTKELLEKIDIPVKAIGGISDKNLQKLRLRIPFDNNTIFDSSDFYEYVLNEEISNVNDWDFVDDISSYCTIRLCRLFVNCCIPVYHIHSYFMKGKARDKQCIDENEIAMKLCQRDINIFKEIELILKSNGFTKCPIEILKNRYPQLRTDLVESNASIYECLFSDFYLLSDDKEIIFV